MTAAAVGSLLLLAGDARAQDPPPRLALDTAAAPALLGSPGAAATGTAVAGPGDVNGDGAADLAVANGGEDHGLAPGPRQGVVQIVFGPLRERAVLGAVRGILVRPPGRASPRVRPAGDLDADGLADVVVMAAGAGWVVWGRRDPAVVLLGDPDGAAARLDTGAAPLADAVAAGDVDGDGRDDLVLGTPIDAAGLRSPGAALIVHGGTRALTTTTTIGGAGPGSGFGRFVAGVGDLDADGYDDVAVSAIPLGRFPTGTTGDVVRVVRGAAGRAPVDVGDPERVWSITLGPVGRAPQPSPWAAGDVNGDGRDDLAIVDANWVPAGVQAQEATINGRVSVVFGGGTTPVDLSVLGDRGFTVLDVPGTLDGIGDSGVAVLDRDAGGRNGFAFGANVSADRVSPPAAAVVRIRPGVPPGTYRLDDGRAVESVVLKEANGFHSGAPGSLAAGGDQDGDGVGDLLVGLTGAVGVTCRSIGGAGVVLGSRTELPPDRTRPGGTDLPQVLVGSAGSDALRGARGADTIDGREGDDCLDAGHDAVGGTDTVLGGPGDDTLAAGSGPARLDAGPGDDRIADIGEERPGGDGTDTLLGGEGSDVIEHRAGAVRIAAGAGDDVVTDGGTGLVELGPGDDAYSGITGFDAAAGPHRVDGGAGDDRIAGGGRTDVLRGGDGDDVLRTGEGGAGRLIGGDGVDRLTGGRRADRLLGGRGADRLSGGGGRDELTGGPGVDRIHAADGERDVIRCDGDRDRLVVDRLDRLVRCSRARVTRRPLPARGGR